ncbi:MAG: lactate dehydrogenase [Thermoprotei archaeon]|nr:MAG: lactate dehydrogenase [Thermoprotei archaeon]
MDKRVIEKLVSIVGKEWVVTDPRAIERYLYDEAPEPIRPQPMRDVVVVKPGSTEEVAGVLKLANEEKIPVFPRGGGTGLVGGAVPTAPGIVLSLERMDRVVIHREDMVAEAEAGVTLAKLTEEAEKAGLFFPPHPGDEGAFVGGLIATNAGGARAVRTGVMRNYVLGLEVVLPTGVVARIGGKTIKNNLLTNVMHLFVGCEGLLGVITKAFLRLYPKPRASATMVVPFDDRLSAIRAAYDIMMSGTIPMLLEYVELSAIERSEKHLGLQWPTHEGFAHLMISFAEHSEDAMYLALETVNSIAEKYTKHEPVLATRRDEQSEILRIRSEIYTALKKDMVDILDVTLPLSKIYEFMERVDALEEEYKTWIPAYGHVGDGNLHLHIMKNEGWSAERYNELREKVYSIAVELGGSITGEHGIGAARSKYLEKYADRGHLELLKLLKKSLDPNNILNPGRVPV